MKKLFVLFITIIIVASISFAGCTKIEKVNSDTTDYFVMCNNEIIYGDKRVNLLDYAYEYLGSEDGEIAVTTYYCYNQYIYATLKYNKTDIFSTRVAHDFVRINATSGEFTVIKENVKNVMNLFSYNDIIFYQLNNNLNAENTQYLFNNVSKANVELSHVYSVSASNKLYRTERLDNGVKVVTAELKDDNVVEKSEYVVLYQNGTNAYNTFIIYDDCVIADRFIYDIANDEYTHIPFRVRRVEKNIFAKTKYNVVENGNVLSIDGEDSYVLLKDARFVPVSDDEVVVDKMKNSVFVTQDRKFFSNRTKVELFDSIKTEDITDELNKDARIKQLMKMKYSSQMILPNGNIALTFRDEGSQTMATNKKTSSKRTLGLFIVNVKSKETTFLGTFSVDGFYQVYISQIQSA